MGDDLIEGMVRMMNRDGDFYGPVNLGNPTEFSINELASLIVQETKSKSKIIHVREAPDDPERRKPDITLAGNKLSGWRPVVPLQDGLKKTIEYFASLDLTQFRPPTSEHGQYKSFTA